MRAAGVQRGACDLCGADHKPLVSDHHHLSRRPRSLLCAQCNLTVGIFETRAAYVERVRLYTSGAWRYTADLAAAQLAAEAAEAEKKAA